MFILKNCMFVCQPEMFLCSPVKKAVICAICLACKVCRQCQVYLKKHEESSRDVWSTGVCGHVNVLAVPLKNTAAPK